MSNPTTQFRCSTSSDIEALFVIQRISKQLSQNPEHVVVSISPMNHCSFGQFTLPTLDSKDFVQLAKDRDTAIWDRISVHFQDLELSLSIRRDREQGDDQIHVSFAKQHPEEPVVTETLSAIYQHFTPRNQSVALEKAMGPELTEFYRLREDTLSRLEATTSKLLQDTSDYRVQLDNQLEERNSALTASFDERMKKADDEVKQRDEDLRGREKELERQRRDLDDRSARHARREQSKALQKKISDRSTGFALTVGTQKKRWPIHVIFALLLAVSASLIVRSLFFAETPPSEDLLWLEVARLPLGLLGFGLTSVFYIRWNDLWFRQHADQEFRLQQLALDVDRAGYAVEMLLEWEDAEKGEMPSVMLDRLTTGLFTDQPKAERARHPAEDVTSALLKVASQASVSVPGIGEVTLTGSGLRKLDRKLQKRDKE